MGFLDNVFNNNDKDKKKKSNSTGGGGNNANPLANLGKTIGQPNSFGGQGQSLGGSKPGVVIEIILSNPGPIGVRVEKRSTASASAIVNHVIPQSQADHAGLQRGDVICFAGSNGQDEMQYDMFLQIAKSTQRPISSAAAASANANTNTAAVTSSGSADAEARRKAMIAAVDAREKAHKQKTKPTKKYVTKTTLLRQQELQLGNNNFITSDEPQSEESRQAAIAAKRDEINHANELGYNPYAAAKSTAGQARNATVTTQHGEISSSTGEISSSTGGGNGGGGGSGGSSIPVVAPPSNPTTATTPATATATDVDYPLPEEFEEALVTIVSSSSQDTTAGRLKIARTLITNATNKLKGQQEDIDAGAKFRKVRLENPKIKAAIVDIPGTIQLLLSVGFQLMECEENQESVLLFPSCQTYTEPEWLSTALRKMEQQEKLLLKNYYNKHRNV
ncbi:hypothetical protein FRACYDRAFT_278408 [Fragilariopsis cylindrus CCMP1102]|uniref:PUB domain-containing protein n=1 Tax=Fragilariopsis cylindrus CCMP1102 TaxID=635003 RepID=A0A1E7EL37_9STRA|nr:hypothetical protein FRACYDRAFT_278408 [Fragilariopsis cylindrus CCMP1102]|eukprot:OEU06631.1 hypothetical protein FRACYDRAFT_278408 [Fragilariopsis cylindrus CCMP1102]